MKAHAVTDTALVTGAQYVRHITRRSSDRRARAAFQCLARSLVPPGARLLDFGCGTGLDATVYAQQGFHVTAYDVDVNMREYFAQVCRAPLASGHIVLEGGTYAEFLTRCGAQRVELITANFAPLNLIADLTPLFAAFHARTQPGARVLASVLSPFFLGDLRYPWWWRNLVPLLRRGCYAVSGAQASIVRRTPAEFARRAAPYFTLERVFRGLPARLDVPAPARLRLMTSRFMFLQFVRQEAAASRQASGARQAGRREVARADP
jgi:SAM-dependent methyltransferase